MKKIIIFLIAATIIIGAAIFGLSLYNQPHREASDEDAVASVTATELYEAYSSNEQKSNELYLDKVLEVQGIIAAVNKEANDGLSVQLETSSDMGLVVCMLSPEQKLSKLDKGSEVKIKGICTGFTLDVVLVRCSIIN